jgi:hypothetical protein
MGQQEGDAAVDQTIACGQHETVNIFGITRDGSDDTKKDTRNFRRGLGKGSGVLLPGVTAFFLAKDAFGHNDGNRAIVADYFC